MNVNLKGDKMGSKELFEQALGLTPKEKIALVEHLLNSIDEPDKKIDLIWAEEAEKRLKSYREGRLEGVPMEKVFNNE